MKLYNCMCLIATSQNIDVFGLNLVNVLIWYSQQMAAFLFWVRAYLLKLSMASLIALFALMYEVAMASSCSLTTLVSFLMIESFWSDSYLSLLYCLSRLWIWLTKNCWSPLLFFFKLFVHFSIDFDFVSLHVFSVLSLDVKQLVV